MVRELFDFYLDQPACMPPQWQAEAAGAATTARVVADFIAGMTDRYALQEWHRLLGMDDHI